jgi:hypothetical protein
VLTVVQNYKPVLRAKDLQEPPRQISICPFLDADRLSHRRPHESLNWHSAQID